MTARVVLATRNSGKIAELARLVSDANLDIELLGAKTFAGLADVAETGSTFAANALLKARAASAHTRLPAIADDSGICVDALNGMPGILSARWSGRHGDDQGNLDLLLAQLSEVAPDRRGAHFYCSVAVVLPPAPDGAPGECRVVEGQIDGQLLREPRGHGGFGYDPIFVPHGFSQTTAEMAPAEKDAISHRGSAFRALVPVLGELLLREGREA